MSLPEERALVRQMDLWRYPAMQVLLHQRRVGSVWSLRSQVGIAHLNVARRPPPYAWCPHTKANRLRTAARGGVHVLLTWEVYGQLRGVRVPVAVGEGGGGSRPEDPPLPKCDDSTGPGQQEGAAGGPEGQPPGVQPPATATTTAAECPLCKGGEALTIPHMLRDCPGLEDTRRQVWCRAQAFLRDKGSNAPAATQDPTHAMLRHGWYTITLGEECPRGFVMGTALEWQEQAEAASVSTMLPSCPMAQRAAEHAGVSGWGHPEGLSDHVGVEDLGHDGSQAPQLVPPLAWHEGSESEVEVGVDGGDSDSELWDDLDHDGDSGDSGDDIEGTGVQPEDVVREGEGLGLGDLLPPLTLKQQRARLRAQQRRLGGGQVRPVLVLPGGQRVSGLASRLHLWTQLLNITGALLELAVEAVRAVVDPGQQWPSGDPVPGAAHGPQAQAAPPPGPQRGAVPPGDPGAVSAPRPRGRPRLAPLPANNRGVDHGDGHVDSDKVRRRRRGRPSLTPAQLAARWLAARHRSTPPRNSMPDAEYVEAKMRARQQAADRRSADPGAERRPRGRPRKQPEMGATRGGPAPPPPPLRLPRQEQRRGGRGGGAWEGASPSAAPVPPRGRSQGLVKGLWPRPLGSQGQGQGTSTGGNGSPPAPPVPPLRRQHQEQRRGRSGGTREGANPSNAPAPPLGRAQDPTGGLRPRSLGPQGHGQGVSTGRSDSPPAPPVPPPRRQHQEQRRGRSNDVLEGASPSMAPAPPLGPGASTGCGGSLPAPPLPPPRLPHQEQRRGRSGGTREGANPSTAPAPPLGRAQDPAGGLRPRPLGPQGQGQGASGGRSDSPPGPPVPPLCRQHQEQRRGRSSDVLEGASPSTAPAPPLGRAQDPAGGLMLGPLEPQGQGQGACAGRSDSPPAPPVPPLRRQHQEQRRGLGGATQGEVPPDLGVRGVVGAAGPPPQPPLRTSSTRHRGLAMGGPRGPGPGDDDLSGSPDSPAAPPEPPPRLRRNPPRG